MTKTMQDSAEYQRKKNLPKDQKMRETINNQTRDLVKEGMSEGQARKLAEASAYRVDKKRELGEVK